MKLSHSIKTLLLVILTAACSKDDTVVPGNCYLTSISGGGLDLTLEYDSKNQIANVTSQGVPYVFTYDSKGKITSMVKGMSTTVFTYNAKNLVVSSSNWSPGSDTLIMTYGYNSSEQVVSESYYVYLNSEYYPAYQQIYYTYPNTTTRNYTRREVMAGPVSTFEYDTKNSPTIAIKALQFILIGDAPFTDNNFTKRTDGVSYITYSYQYNDHGYPTRRTAIFSDAPTATEVVRYAYNCK